ncbi:UNVERIFIED_CONTAM: hypothetical protein Cloal_2410 [Acetivibrio alkalicellulosi]
MKYLENAFKFFRKYYFLAIPLLIVNAIIGVLSAILFQFDYIGLLEEFMDSFQIGVPVDDFRMEELFMGMIPEVGMILILVGLFFFLNIIVMPATFGMINKAYSTGEASLDDFLPQLSKNFMRYILFLLGVLLVGIIISLAVGIVSVIFSLLSMVCCIFSIVLIPIMLLYIIGFVVFMVGYYMWFSIMIIDNLGVFDALSKTYRVIKSYFWPIVGISMLITVCMYIASVITGLMSFLIPFVGQILSGVVSAIYTFIMIAFVFEVYIDKTKGGSDDGGTYIDGLPEEYM